MTETAVRTSERGDDIDTWSLVLTALGVPHRVDRVDARWYVLVADAQVADALAALDGYDAERDGDTGEAAPRVRPMASWGVGLSAGAALLGFFAVTGPAAAGGHWFAGGAASAWHIAHGELFRTVTALTLHVDGVHVLGNAVATAALLAVVGQELGPGAALAVVLVAGAAANFLSAIVREAGYVAVGASTATFGAVGILAGLRLVAGREPSRPGSSRWAVVIVALVLLAMLGTAPGADALAHAFGLVTGGGLGVLAGVTGRGRRLGASWQRILIAISVAAVIACWRAALAR